MKRKKKNDVEKTNNEKKKKPTTTTTRFNRDQKKCELVVVFWGRSIGEEGFEPRGVV